MWCSTLIFFRAIAVDFRTLHMCSILQCTNIIKKTQTALFSKNVYWHIRVANVRSYHSVAGITHDIWKSCKGVWQSTKTIFLPLKIVLPLPPITLWASTNSNKLKKKKKKNLLNQHQVWHSWQITFEYAEKQGSHNKAANQILQSCRPPLLRMLHSPSSFFSFFFSFFYLVFTQ